jgi:hypothetical protein
LPKHRTNEPSAEPASEAAPVPQRSARRATARRASSRRATARLYRDDLDARVDAYLDEHPDSTAGDIAKALNADRGVVAARLAHLAAAADEPAPGA